MRVQRTGVPSVLSKTLLFIITIHCCVQQKLFLKIKLKVLATVIIVKVKGFGYSDNCKIVQKKSINIIFCAYDIWYLCARSITRVISSARTSAIVLFSWQGLYKALPINKKLSQEMLGVVYLN